MVRPFKNELLRLIGTVIYDMVPRKWEGGFTSIPHVFEAFSGQREPWKPADLINHTLG